MCCLASYANKNAVEIPFAENLWGNAKRLQFVDGSIACRFGGNRQAIRVLDIGCGNGTALAIPLAKIGYRIFGVDPHAKSISRAVALAPASAKFHCGQLSDIPPERFHAIIISEVLEHLDDPDSLLSASLSYLAEDGLLVITVPNGYGEFEIDSRLFRNLRLDFAYDVARDLLWRVRRRERPAPAIGSSDNPCGHVQRFTLSRLMRMFAGNGLRVVQSCASCFISGPLVCITLGRLESFIRLNVKLADWLPLRACSGWFFALERAELKEEKYRYSDLPPGTTPDRSNTARAISA